MAGKRGAAVLLCAITIGSAACTGSPPQPATISPGKAASPPASTAPPVAVCFGAMPADWTRALHARSVISPAGTYFGPGGILGGAAIGQFNSASESGIGLLDMTTGRLTTIARLPGPAGGMGGMEVDPPWVVWEELDSQDTVRDQPERLDDSRLEPEAGHCETARDFPAK